jgi:hypothetical protein
MEEQRKNRREEVFSKVVRAGKRTYFLDVKETRNGEQYLTITESKRRFDNESGKFFYEKHKLFLYQEDFEKFSNGLLGVIEFIKTGEFPEKYEMDTDDDNQADQEKSDDVSFEDLDENESKAT